MCAVRPNNPEDNRRGGPMRLPEPDGDQGRSHAQQGKSGPEGDKAEQGKGQQHHPQRSRDHGGGCAGFAAPAGRTVRVRVHAPC